MKAVTVKLGSQSVKTIWSEGEHRVALDVCVPNDWNMNKMPPDIYEKTKLVIKETIEEAGRIPPITVRPLPGKKRLLQIIDGYHRWKILAELGYSEIDTSVIYVSDQRAMQMTAELNYNRGEPDMEKYPEYLARLIKTFDDVDATYLSQRLPDSKDEIESYLDSIDFEVDDVKIPIDDEDDESSNSATKDESQRDALLELKFVVRQGAGEVIEKELARLGAHLGGGKNVRGRSLEVMAVLSSQTPEGSIASSMDEEDDSSSVSVAKARKKRKKKLKNDE